MSRRLWGSGLFAALAAAVVLSAQAPEPAASANFRLFMLGREVGREVSALSTTSAGRKIESVITFKDRGTDARLTATVDADFGWEPRHLVLKGQPFAGATTDLDVVVTETRATIRDRGVSSTLDIGTGLFFPIEGAMPVALQESLIAYWRSHGRPASIRAAPGGAVRIQVRADEQIDVGGRPFLLQRLTIDGPVWGRQTAWVEPGGNLNVLVTWVDGIPFQAVREGFQGQLDRFMDRAIRDRVEDLDRLVVIPEHPGGVVLSGATVFPAGGRPVIPDAVVVVRGGRIAAVGPASRLKPPGDLPRVDVSGMTIVPGLLDASASLSQIELGPLHLAAGITSIRSIGPDQVLAAALRAAEADREGRVLGPRVIPAGRIEAADADGSSVRVATVEAVRDAARKFRADGLRRLDVSHWLAPALFRVAATEGRRLGMGVAGSIPAGMTVQEAVGAGLDFLVGWPAGSDAASWLPFLVKEQIAFAPQAAAAEHAPLPATGGQLPASFARRFALLDRAADRAQILSQLRSAREAGATIVGVSGPGAPVLGLLREVELFVESGMTPADAIQSVTSVAARVMKTEDAGTIEPGKRADLLVLSGNPLIDIANIRTARWVVANGRLYDVAKLRALVN
jgi:hypothetical protein